MNKPLLTPMAALLLLVLAVFHLSHEAQVKADNHEDAKQDAKAEWVVLFDGTSTEHFRGYKKEGFPEKGWVIEDGTLRKVAKAGGGDIITKKQYDSFELYWEWKVAAGANSGIMYRVAETNGPSYKTGPEYQILEDTGHRDGKNAKTSTGALYALIACNDKKKLNDIGEWNTSRILMDADHVEHWLNGEKVVEYTWGSDKIKELIADSKFKSWPEFMTQKTGYIAFQDHGNDVWFRNIKIREIDAE